MREACKQPSQRQAKRGKLRMRMNHKTAFMALGLAVVNSDFATVACFPGRLLYSVYTLLRSPEAAFKRRLMGVLEHPEPPPRYATVEL